MFVYSFKSTKSIIQHIVISGQHITLYTSQANCMAIQPLINQLKLHSIMSGDHPNHDLLHNPFLAFSSKGDAIPHMHLKFSNSNRRKNLEDIFKFSLKRQHSPELRKKERDQLIRDLHKEREANGDKEFSRYIKQSIEEYDVTTPFFSEKELDDLLSAFDQYNQSHSFSFYAEQISIHIEKILNENWSIIYNKIISFSDDDLSDDLLQVFKYYKYLGELRLALLGIHHKNSAKWCDKAIEAIDTIKVNPYYKQFILAMPSFAQTLEVIQKKIAAKVKELNRKSIIMIAAGLILVDYFRVDSTNEYVRDIITISIASITTHYTIKPIMKLSNNLYRIFTRPTPLSEKPINVSIIEVDCEDAYFDTSIIKARSARVVSSKVREEQLVAIKKELKQDGVSETLGLTLTR